MNRLEAALTKIVNRPWLFAVVLLAAGLAIYTVSFENRFLLDDESQIRNNPIVHSPANLPIFFLGSTMNQKSATALAGIYYKPVMSFCYSLMWWMTPDNPTLFHVFQLLLAVVNAFLAFLFLRRHLTASVAALMSLLFLVHPINSEVVVYIADLQDVLYTFFGLLALNLVAGCSALNLKSSLGLAAFLFLALLSKESGILYVVLSAVYIGVFRREWLKRALWISLGVVAGYLYLRLGVAHLTALTHEQNQIGRASLGVRLLTAPLVLASYLWKFVFPADITATQDWVNTRADFENFWLPLLAVTAVLVASFVYASRQWKISRRFAFFVFWVFMGMGFHSHILVALDGTVADRWFYFASLGLLGMIGVLIENFSWPRARALTTAAVLLWAAGLGVRSYLRSLDWYDNFTLCEHDLKIFPNSYDMHNNLGVEHFRRGRIAEAKAEFERSVELAPNWDVNWNNLGSVYFRLGDSKRAEESYIKSMEHGLYYMAYENYASLLAQEGRFSEAKKFINEKALPLFPASESLIQLSKSIENK